MSQPTQQQLELMCHALGICPEKTHPFRNHFAASPKSEDYKQWELMAAAGWATPGRTNGKLYANLVFYQVTEAGELHARVFNKSRKPKLTESQRRYQDYLDADTSETFREWIKRKQRNLKATGAKY